MISPIFASVSASVTFDEEAVNAAPVALMPNIVVTDPEGNFSGGTLNVYGLLDEDRVTLRDTGGITVSGTAISFGGAVIGAAFTVTFNANATTAAVQAAARALGYANGSEAPTASWGLTITLTDADGIADFTLRAANDSPFTGINVGSLSAPTFAEFDRDGDLDLMVGTGDGKVLTWLNPGGVYTATDTSNEFAGLDVGGRSTPAFIDLDRDGELDLVVG